MRKQTNLFKKKFFLFQSNRGGFTLIELLVVVAIISLLSSIVFASLNTARAKARDARRKQDMREISKALYLYYDKNGTMPTNEPNAQADQSNYNQAMQKLVDEKFLPNIPSDPLSSGKYVYIYYYYRSNLLLWQNVDVQGKAIVRAILETGPATFEGIPPSCRFSWSLWCNDGSQSSNRTPTLDYCICNPP